MSYTIEKQGGCSRASSIYFPVEDRWFSLRGLYQVFFMPTGFLRNLRNRQSILMPYLIFGVLIIAYSLSILDIEIGAILADMRTRGVDTSIMPSAEAMRPLMFLSKISVILNPFVVTLIALFLLSISKIESNFNKVLSIIIYSEVIYTFGLLLSSVLVIITNNIYASFSFSLAALKLGYKPTSAMFFLVSKLDIFFIWQIMFVAKGFQVVLDCPERRSYLISILSVGCLSIMFLLSKL